MTELTEQEWRLVRIGMETAGAMAGFKSDINPLPWVKHYHEVLRKIQDNHPLIPWDGQTNTRDDHNIDRSDYHAED